jgi:hypothetical protein
MSRFSLREDTPVGSAVYTLRARDPENGTVEYSISGDHLSVDRTTGIVTLIRALDREKEDVLRVIVSITGEWSGLVSFFFSSLLPFISAGYVETLDHES